MMPWREVVPPGPIWAMELNALAAEVRRLANQTVDGLDQEDGPAGRQLTVHTEPRYKVKVYADAGGSGASGSGASGGCDRTPYRWVLQKPKAHGEWEDDPSGVRGGVDQNTPAYEFNSAVVPDGTVVEISPGTAWIKGATVVREWVFAYGDAPRECGEDSGSGASGDGSGGAGCTAGTPMDDLFQCADTGARMLKGCLAVRLPSGGLMPVVLVDENGNVIAGG